MLAGIGGQGILFALRIFSELGLRAGLDVIGSETHGMSQRGGSVTAHLKLGSFHSPMIRLGSADILYSFEEKETYNSLKYLRKGGVCFVNLENPDLFDSKVLAHMKTKEISFYTFDAGGAALRLGSVLSANIVLIGYSVGADLVPFKKEDVKTILEAVSRKKTLKINLEAFETGFEKGKLSKS